MTVDDNDRLRAGELDPDPTAGLAPVPSPPDPTAAWQPLAALPEDWLERTPPERPALLHTERGSCYLPRGKVAFLVAPGGRGKTQALADLAVAVASGGAWLRTYPVEAPGRVLLAFGEEDLDEAQRRLHLVAFAQGLLPDPEGWRRPEARDRWEALRKNLVMLPLYGSDCSLQDKEDPEAPTQFYRALQARLADGGPWALVILDPGSRFMGPEAETDNAAATRFVELCEVLTQAPGSPTVLLAHHTSKPYQSGRQDQGAARGSSALVDGARWMAAIERVTWPDLEGAEERAKAALVNALGPQAPSLEAWSLLRLTKTNYGPPVDPLPLVMKDDGILSPADKHECLALEAAKAAARKKVTEPPPPGRGSAGKAEEAEQKAQEEAERAERARKERARAY